MIVRFDGYVMRSSYKLHDVASHNGRSVCLCVSMFQFENGWKYSDEILYWRVHKIYRQIKTLVRFE
jgi:hypothetical protein